MLARASRGARAATWNGYRTVAATWRTRVSAWKRASTTSSAIESRANTVTLTLAGAPCLKSGGGLYSMTSNYVLRTPRHEPDAQQKPPIRLAPTRHSWPGLLVREDRTQLVHALERHARTAHHAGQRIFGDQ